MGYLDTDHVIPVDGTIGLDEPSFFDSVRQGYQQQYKVDSPYSLEAEIQQRWQRSLDSYAQITGDKPAIRMDLSAFNTYARSVQGLEPSKWQQGITTSGFQVSPELQQDISNFKRLNDAMKALNRPEVQSFEAVLADVVKMQQGVEAQSARTAEMGGTSGAIGQFIGAMGGSLSERDPVALGTLGVGGFGRSIAMRVATEGLVQGGVAAVQEYGSVEPNRALAGLPGGSPVTNIIAAATLGAGLRGAGEGLNYLVRSRLKGPEVAFDFNDDQLASMFKAAPESPKARAGLHVLEGQQAFEAANPYGKSAQGTARFVAELEDVKRVLSGQPDTALARVIPEQAYDIQLLDADIALVRGESPQIHDAFVATETRLNEIDAEINGAETGLDQVSIADAVSVIDEDSGGLVRSLLDDMDVPALPAEQRIALETKVNQIIETIGPKTIERVLNDIKIAPKKELQTLRQSRKAAVKQYKFAKAEMDRRIAQIKTEQRVKDMAGQKAAAPLAKAADAPAILPLLKHEAVEAVVKQTEVANAIIPERALAISKAVVDENGMIDIGDGDLVPAAFELEFEMPDGTTRKMSVQKIMDDLADDIALEEVMKVCSL